MSAFLILFSIVFSSFNSSLAASDNSAEDSTRFNCLFGESTYQISQFKDLEVSTHLGLESADALDSDERELIVRWLAENALRSSFLEYLSSESNTLDEESADSIVKFLKNDDYYQLNLSRIRDLNSGRSYLYIFNYPGGNESGRIYDLKTGDQAAIVGDHDIHNCQVPFVSFAQLQIDGLRRNSGVRVTLAKRQKCTLPKSRDAIFNNPDQFVVLDDLQIDRLRSKLSFWPYGSDLGLDLFYASNIQHVQVQTAEKPRFKLLDYSSNRSDNPLICAEVAGDFLTSELEQIELRAFDLRSPNRELMGSCYFGDTILGFARSQRFELSEKEKIADGHSRYIISDRTYDSIFYFDYNEELNWGRIVLPGAEKFVVAQYIDGYAVYCSPSPDGIH